MKYRNFTKLDDRGFTHHFVVPVLVMVVVGVLGIHVLKASHAEQLPTTSTSIASPVNLQLNDASTTEASLIWTPTYKSNVTYNILRNGTKVGSTNGYTANYLDTGLTPGNSYTYTVTAQKGTQVSPQSGPLIVSTGTTTTPITSCGASIVTGGNYVLTSNLTVSPTANYDCLNVSNANHFSLDCQHHTLTLKGSFSSEYIMTVSSGSNFMITNCTFIASGSSLSKNPYVVLSLTSPNNVTIENNTFGVDYSVHKNFSELTAFGGFTNLVVNHNNFASSELFVNGGFNTYVGDNNFTYSGAIKNAIAAIICSNGLYNVVYNNTIDGGSVDGTWNLGLDDGILIGSDNATGAENNDIVANNTINNIWDAGIEPMGVVNGTHITSNIINNAYITGIGSYHYTSWKGNFITNNSVSFTTANPNGTQPKLFYIFEAETIPAGTKIFFQNNTISANTFNPGTSYIKYKYPSSIIDFSPTDYPNVNSNNSVLSNNVLSNNNMSNNARLYAPLLLPQSMIIDGGGNICTNTIDPGIPPPIALACN